MLNRQLHFGEIPKLRRQRAHSTAKKVTNPIKSVLPELKFQGAIANVLDVLDGFTATAAVSIIPLEPLAMKFIEQFSFYFHALRLASSSLAVGYFRACSAASKLAPLVPFMDLG